MQGSSWDTPVPTGRLGSNLTLQMSYCKSSCCILGEQTTIQPDLSSLEEQTRSNLMQLSRDKSKGLSLGQKILQCRV